MYLTARPEWLVGRTRDFLELGPVGNGRAAAFKTEELRMLAAKGLVPTFGFGNRPTDSEAYAPIPTVNNRIFFQIDGEFTGRRIESYEELLPRFARVAAVSRK